MQHAITETQELAAKRLPVAPDFLNGFISEDEYADRRRVTIRTCQRDRQLRRSPPYVQFGRRIFYRVDAVREWLVNNERADAMLVRAPLTPSRRIPGRWTGRQS